MSMFTELRHAELDKVLFLLDSEALHGEELQAAVTNILEHLVTEQKNYKKLQVKINEIHSSSK